MYIKNLKVDSFKGIEQETTKTFGKINVFTGKNGSGKTSMISAIRFIVTGAKPSGEMIHAGAKKATVGMTLENGDMFVKSHSDLNTTWASRIGSEKKFSTNTMTVFNERLSAASGVEDVRALNTPTSSELLRAINGKELADLLMKRIDQNVDRSEIMSCLPYRSTEVDGILEAVLPTGEISVGALKSVYQVLYNDRRETKKQVTDLTRQLSRIADSKIDRSEEDIQKSLKETSEKIAKYGEYEAAFRSYEEKKKAKEKSDAEILRFEKELSELKIPEIKKSRETLEAEKEWIQRSTIEAERAISAMKLTVEQHEKILAALSGSLCPISEKLICKTDKTSVKAEVENALTSSKERLKIFELQANKIKIFQKNNTEYFRILEEKEKKEARKQYLIDALASLKKASFEIGDIPKMPFDKAKLDEAQRRDLADLKAIQSCGEKTKLKEALTEKEALLHAYETLVGLFAPDGEITKNVMKSYVAGLERACAASAKAFGMDIAFDTRDGIVPFLDTGNGVFLPMDCLSGGEQMILVFCLQQMLASVMRSRIIILDELSVLDAEYFDEFISLIQEHDDLYDQIFISLVNHADMMDVLKKHNISALEA